MAVYKCISHIKNPLGNVITESTYLYVDKYFIARLGSLQVREYFIFLTQPPSLPILSELLIEEGYTQDHKEVYAGCYLVKITEPPPKIK